MSEHAYRSMVAHAAADQLGPKGSVVDELVATVRDGAAAGDPECLAVMDRWCRRGADADYTRAHKDLHAITYVRRDGRRVRKTASYSRPVVDARSGDIVGQQLTVWWGMDRPALVNLRDDLRGQLGALADAVRLATEVLRVMDRHPDCETAGAAWLADGRSMGEIDLADTG